MLMINWFTNNWSLQVIRFSSNGFAFYSDASWYSKLEGTLWLSYISQLLKAAVDVAVALEVQCRPVMVHCTDGWDRTPQLTSLAELLIDPYYRTIEVSACINIISCYR